MCIRRGGRVVDGSGLENRRTRKGTGGSNPSLSARSLEALFNGFVAQSHMAAPFRDASFQFKVIAAGTHADYKGALFRPSFDGVATLGNVLPCNERQEDGGIGVGWNPQF